MSTLYLYPHWSSCHWPIVSTRCPCPERAHCWSTFVYPTGRVAWMSPHYMTSDLVPAERKTRCSAYSKSCTGTMQIHTQKNPSSSHHSPLVTCSSYPSAHQHRQCHQRQRLCCSDSMLSTTSSLISVRRGGTCQFQWQDIQNFKHSSDTNPFYEVQQITASAFSW